MDYLIGGSPQLNEAAHNDDLKTNGAGRSRFRPLMIGMLGEEMQIEAVLQAKWFADSAREMRAITSEMRRSPVNRAWCDGLRWYPMPQLPNHSGYDRDSRSVVETQKPPRDSKASGIEPDKEEGSKTNCSKPKLSRTELMLVIAELGEWLDKNSGLSFDQSYSNYNARRKGLSRPEFRYLLLQVEQLDPE